MKTVLIGCKLPHGIVLTGMDGGPIVINGINTARVIGGFGLTTVGEAEAAYLFATYQDFAPFQSQSIFTGDSPKVADIQAMGRELSDERTGFEGMDPDKPGAGLKPEINVDKALEDAERASRPVKAPMSPADKAAAAELAGQ